MILKEILNVIDPTQRISIHHNDKYIGIFENSVALSYLNPIVLTYTVENLFTTDDADIIYIYIINVKRGESQ